MYEAFTDENKRIIETNILFANLILSGKIILIF